MNETIPAAPVARPGVVAGLVPLTARPTLFYDLRSAPLNGLFLGVLTLLPWVLKETFHGSDWEVAVLTAAPAVAHVFDLYWAHLCQFRRKMPFVLWPGLVARALIVLCGLAVNSTMLLMLGSLSFVIGSISTPAINSIWRTNYPGTHRYGVFSVVLSVTTLASATTGFGAGMLLRQYPAGRLWSAVLVVGGVAGMMGVLVFSRIRVRGEAPAAQESAAAGPPQAPTSAGPGGLAGVLRITLSGVGLLRRDRAFGKYMLIQFMTGGANLMTGPVLVALLAYQGADWLKAAMVLTVASDAMRATLMPFWGRILQRFNPMLSRGMFNLLWAGAFVMIALSGRNVAWVIVARLIVGAAMGGTTLLWSLQQMYFARKEDLTRYMGVHCMLTGIRGILAPFLGVIVMEQLFHGQPHYVFLLAAAIIACASVLSFRLGWAEYRSGRSLSHTDGGGRE